MKYLKYMLVCLAAVSMLSGCAKESAVKNETTKAQESEKKAQRDIFAMDTYMSLLAYGEKAEEAVDAGVAEIEHLDALLSTGDEKSDIAEANANGGGAVSEDAGYLIERSLELNKETDGAFDLSIYPVMSLWGFPTQEFKVPEKKELKETLPLVDAKKVHYDKENSEVTFDDKKMQIDLGGIAKGYTSAKVIDIFREYGIENAIINLGGNVQVMGKRTDGGNWRVAVQDPENTDEVAGVLSVTDKAVITSGGYERYFEQDGKRYHHIIDPNTGYPVENGILSVTIVSSDGTLADGLSTSLFIMGKEKAIKFWKKHSDEFDAIIMTDDHKVYITEGIYDDFETKRDSEKITK